MTDRLREAARPAFPTATRQTEQYMDEGGYGRSRIVTVDVGGATLRDYFAAGALPGLLYMVAHGAHTAAESPEGAAREAYRLADAMLEARNA